MRWTGKCPDCGEWNTLTEEVYQESKTESHRTPLSAIQPQKLSDIRAEDIRRLPINIGELSRVLGGWHRAGVARAHWRGAGNWQVRHG